MKPSVNISLSILAQELVQRVVPLLNDDYERSRLSSWAGLLILASFDIDRSPNCLEEQNQLMRDWLTKFLKKVEEDGLKRKIKSNCTLDERNMNLESLEIKNQALLLTLVETQAYFEEKLEKEALIECWKLLRRIHNYRKVSHLLPLLKG